MDQSVKTQSAGMEDLFSNLVPSGHDDQDNVYCDVLAVKPWPEKERLYREKDTLDLFWTRHLLDACCA